jgi:hypothetical protein
MIYSLGPALPYWKTGFRLHGVYFPGRRPHLETGNNKERRRERKKETELIERKQI